MKTPIRFPSCKQCCFYSCNLHPLQTCCANCSNYVIYLLQYAPSSLHQLKLLMLVSLVSAPSMKALVLLSPLLLMDCLWNSHSSSKIQYSPPFFFFSKKKVSFLIPHFYFLNLYCFLFSCWDSDRFLLVNFPLNSWFFLTLYRLAALINKYVFRYQPLTPVLSSPFCSHLVVLESYCT